MAINSLSPAFIVVRYTRSTVPHTSIIPTKFSGTPTPGSNPNLLNHFGVAVDFESAMAAWAILLQDMFSTAVTLDTAEVWSQPTPDDDPVWIFTTGLALTGTRSGTAVVAGQQVLTFRTHLGGLFRLYFMETPVPPNQVATYAGMANPELELANFVTGATSWLYGRDNGQPILTLGWKTKTNDVLRRKLLTG